MNIPIADALREAFNGIGKRFTTQRRRVWEVFNEAEAGLTTTQAAERLKPENIGHTTVYRTVRELTDLGFLKWVHGPDGEHRYVACAGGHCHPVVCRVCGKVTLVECEGLRTFHKLIALETGFEVEGHHLEMFGVCPDCR